MKMLKILDKDLRLTVLNNEMNPNMYYISLNNKTKSVIETMNINDEIIFKIDVQGDCNNEELNIIVDKFSSYILSENDKIMKIRIATEDNGLLDEFKKECRKR